MDGDEADDERSALALLLPFYVNGTLPQSERARIETALAADPDLRAELEAVRDIADLVRRGGAEIAGPVATPERLDALLRRIDADAPRPGLRRLIPGRRAQAPSARIGAPARVWKRAFAAALALAVIQSGVLAYQAQSPKTYASLGGPEPSKPAVRRLLLRLDPDASWAQIEALLEVHDLTLSGGPRGGAIEVDVPADADSAELVATLRASRLVTFAGVVN
ncbi:hypothetical protein [Phenylobacterium sp.]|uniref:hypothetical protein n=1 Tax=Phenylobacterium sp. TaxID=1871053 RepID=UPI0027168245|nr:hypothetical protein [Phenylobacterium sp.]MDO8801998.1 hypothetical protein [Phenylobacterium sp.]